MVFKIQTINNIREHLSKKGNRKLNKCSIKTFLLLTGTAFLLFPDTADALTGGGIVGIDNLWAKIKPYLTGAFSIGGVIYCATNVRKVVVGDYRAAAPAAISAILAGLGIQGVFGDNALTATVTEWEQHTSRAISE